MFAYLSPEKLRLETAPDGSLRAEVEGECCVLHLDVVRAFPLSSANTDLVLRDGNDVEIGILASLDGLSQEYRKLLQTVLDHRYFLPKITKIHSVRERFGSSVWKVDTDAGPITIHTKAMQEAVTELGNDRYLLQDTEENRYDIPRLSALDEISRDRFFGKG
jgi:hypothetical protein